MIRSLRKLADDIEAEARTLTVYAEDRGFVGAVRQQFGIQNTQIEYRRLPATVSDRFVVVHINGEFVGAVGLDAVVGALSPSVPTIGRPPDKNVRALLTTFAETAFTSSDRRRLLAATRAFESRAWRVGYGSLHVGFQSATALAQQARGYERMATETDLDIHVYIDDHWDRPPLDGVNVHDDRGGEIGAFWFVAFDDGIQPCALVAEERIPGVFYGFWTEDAALVDDVLDYVQSVQA